MKGVCNNRCFECIHPDCINDTAPKDMQAINRAKYLKNRERYIENAKRWQKENKDRHKEICKRSYEKRKDELNRKYRERYALNPEYYRKKSLDYYYRTKARKEGENDTA